MKSIYSQISLGVFLAFFLIIFIGGIGYVTKKTTIKQVRILNFEECVMAGNLVMESYPRRCKAASGNIFVEEITPIKDIEDVVRISSPLPGQTVTKPIIVKGEARGFWFFEGDFPVELLDSEGNTIYEHFAIAEGEWMTDNFVPFSVTFPFFEGDLGEAGSLILHKANPSGLKENDDYFEILIVFKDVSNKTEVTCSLVSKKAEACIQIFAPVCGKVNVQCITTPCDPIFETFSNSCEACKNQLVESYTEGGCEL